MVHVYLCPILKMEPIPVPSSPMVLDKESLSQQQWCSADTGPSSACIHIVYSSSFQQFNMICPGMGFQAFLQFQVFSAFWRCRFMSLIFHIWEVCSVIALRGFQPKSPLHLWDLSAWVLLLLLFSVSTLSPFFFSVCFLSFEQMGKYYWSVTKSSGSTLCRFHAAIQPIQQQWFYFPGYTCQL